MMDRIPIYQERQEQFEGQLKEAKKRHNILAAVRLAVFAAAILACWLLWSVGPAAIFTVIGLTIAAFLVLMKLSTRIQNQIAYYQALAKINEDEVSAAYGGYVGFEEGNYYLRGEHPYNSDLDVFGRGSIFQYINRTCTLPGRDQLAAWLQHPTMDIEAIKARQEAIKELTPKLEWRQDFQAAGLAQEETREDKDLVMEWVDEPSYFSTKWYFKVLMYLFPAIMFSLIALSMLEIVPSQITAAFFFLQLGIAFAFAKRISHYHNKVSSRHAILAKYSKLLELIEGEQFSAPLLKNLQSKLTTNGKPASQHFNQLTRIVSSFESRQNILAAVFTNGLFLWDLHNSVRLEKWKDLFKEDLVSWFDVPAQFDALNSLATMAYNRPSFNYPEPQQGDFYIEAVGMGHPLLYEATRIDNDLTIGGSGHFILTTGANMAGKSTFLRGIGVNLILAMAGAPICSEQFRFVPVQIYTSMRASDSLLEHESFFYAELMKLKSIIDALQDGQQMFVLLDEILKGTNSKDQQTGSKALLDQLINLKASGMIATHDLELGKLEDEYGGRIRNKCFEIAIEDDELVFDYKLKDGISQSLNATFLMKKMGITV